MLSDHPTKASHTTPLSAGIRSSHNCLSSLILPERNKSTVYRIHSDTWPVFDLQIGNACWKHVQKTGLEASACESWQIQSGFFPTVIWLFTYGGMRRHSEKSLSYLNNKQWRTFSLISLFALVDKWDGANDSSRSNESFANVFLFAAYDEGQKNRSHMMGGGMTCPKYTEVGNFWACFGLKQEKVIFPTWCFQDFKAVSRTSLVVFHDTEYLKYLFQV